MNDLIPLHFEAVDIRMVFRDGEPWWVLIDICRALGIQNHRNKAAALWDWQKDYVQILDAIGRNRNTLIVNEAGAYALILDSRSPDAERFAHWLFTEVLRSIRKWGCYPPPPIALENPAAENWAETSPQERFIAECRRIAAENAVTIDKLLEHIVSKSQLRAIELGSGPIDDLLTRDKRWVQFMGIGMDLRYVLHGIWDQTPHERRIKQQMRAASREQLKIG